MTRALKIATLTALVAWVTAACSSKDAAPAAPEITYQEMPKPPQPDAPTFANTAHDVPVAEDFEDEAEGEITGDNFKGQLDRIEAEINNDRAE